MSDMEAKAAEKRCKKCGIGLPATIEYFYWIKHLARLAHSCKKCLIAEQLKRQRNNWANLVEYGKQYRSKNADRIQNRKKSYAQKNRTQIATQKAAYASKNKERRRIIHRAWRTKNRDHWRAYHRNRYRQLPQAEKLSIAFSRSIRRSIKNKNGATWESIVGYSISDLMAHLERQFTGWMSWSNYGPYWHIDHITPLRLFSYNGRRAAWALSNLRPLLSKENLKKGGNRTHLI